MYDYAIRFERDDSAPGLAVFCRDLPELNSYGDNLEHALEHAVDAIESTLSLYVDQRRLIPPASPALQGEQVIRLPATTVAGIVLWNESLSARTPVDRSCNVVELQALQRSGGRQGTGGGDERGRSGRPAPP